MKPTKPLKPTFDHFCPRCELFTMQVVSSKMGKLGRARTRRCGNCGHKRQSLETLLVPGLRRAIRKLRRMNGEQLALPLVLVLCLLLPGCALKLSHAQALDHTREITTWQRHYEAKMNLPEGFIVFSEAKLDHCGSVGESIPGFEGDDVTVYEVTWRCWKWTAREVALHEACHRRYAHTQIAMPDDAKEREALACAEHYR